jgi:hypothetical protein
MERTTGIEPATPTLGTSCATSCATSAWSLPPVLTRAATPYQGVADADPAGMSWAPGIRTRKLSVQRPSGSAGSPIAHQEPSPECAGLGCRPYRGRPVAGPKGKYARRDSNPQIHGPRPCPSASCGTSAWSRHPVPTRIIRRTKAEPQPCAAAWLPGLESNQRGHGSEPCWAAGSPPGIGTRGGTRTRRRRILSASALPVSVTRACAARDSNPVSLD